MIVVGLFADRDKGIGMSADRMNDKCSGAGNGEFNGERE